MLFKALYGNKGGCGLVLCGTGRLLLSAAAKEAPPAYILAFSCIEQLYRQRGEK